MYTKIGNEDVWGNHWQHTRSMNVPFGNNLSFAIVLIRQEKRKRKSEAIKLSHFKFRVICWTHCNWQSTSTILLSQLSTRKRRERERERIILKMSEEANIDLIEWMYFGVQKPAKKQKVTSSSSYFWDIYSRQEQKKDPRHHYQWIGQWME